MGEVCPEHGLYGITADALTRAEDAPLLGYVLDARFVLIDYLGGGGMGAVYKGRQLSLDRVVAIKVLHASLTATREDRKRFEEEARALSLLQSPHAVTLYDFGVVRDGPLAHMAFMVLEFVEGETLAQRARGGALPAEAVAALLDDVADALDEAHAHGIVHRDLKPANIILSQDHRGNAVVKVIDFGVASFGGRTGLTRTGFSVGTPSYMAPEQFDADGSALVDGRADVYSMGVVAFTALTGQKPFASNSVLELARLHRQAAPPRVPGAEQGGRWAALEQVLHCALAKEPGARFSTMGAFAHAFRDALAVPEDVVMETMRVTVATPIVVGPVESVPTPTESFVGALELAGRPPRRRGWLSLAVTLAVCGAGGGGLALWLTARDAPSPTAEPPLVAEVGGVSEGALPVERIEAVVAVPKGVVSEAPVSEAPVSAAPVSAAPVSAAPVSAAPVSAAPVEPEPVEPVPLPVEPVEPLPVEPLPVEPEPVVPVEPPEPRPVPRERPADPRVAPLASALETALGRCACREAKSALSTLRSLDGGLKVARRLERRVRGCVVPDVDETCRDGKVVSP